MNDDNPQSVLCAGLLALLSVLFLGLAGCDQIEQAGVNSALAADIDIEAERLLQVHQNQPALPDDLGGKQEVAPEQTAPITRRVLLFTDPPRCSPCQRITPELTAMAKNGWKVGRGEGMQIRVIELEEHDDWHQKYRVDSCPTWVLLVNGIEVKRTVGYLDRWSIAQFYHSNATEMPQQNAPEVAQSRPFSESWRAQLPWHIRQSVHTNLDVATVALPTTRINLRSQSVEFSGEPVRSRLNRWFSVSFGPGEVSHEGTTVKFSSPPELHFHLLDDGRKGVRLDSLESIGFESGAVVVNTHHFKGIRFKVQ